MIFKLDFMYYYRGFFLFNIKAQGKGGGMVQNILRNYFSYVTNTFLRDFTTSEIFRQKVSMKKKELLRFK